MSPARWTASGQQSASAFVQQISDGNCVQRRCSAQRLYQMANTVSHALVYGQNCDPSHRNSLLAVSYEPSMDGSLPETDRRLVSL
jgi:hypothetical protein